MLEAALAIPFTAGASAAAAGAAVAAGAVGGTALGAGLGAADASSWKDEFGIPDDSSLPAPHAASASGDGIGNLVVGAPPHRETAVFKPLLRDRWTSPSVFAGGRTRRNPVSI